MTLVDYEALATAAQNARNLAYAPYSHFQVGAAVLTASGKIFCGGNIENAAYPLTICAERVALYSAYAAGEREILALAVVTDTDDVASPCGACRQVMIELSPQCGVLLLNMQGHQRLTTPHELLPHSFGATQLDEAHR
ncbi:cytidine deaminase [Candidatus Chloroploca asiatica]|uniref:Cytidine deaminase n=1 Tax=Candidatus Chloroploca asiatica TaxID=1506545 RepID=A0A2H3L2N8_9CHLR|nr:cytidine deaminase [Candidatus Chloroploca asiatica]PDV97407.1 cytidine deaminase [Candidatus Chloroploca asiatica]